jgi:hypothetical protein
MSCCYRIWFKVLRTSDPWLVEKFLHVSVGNGEAWLPKSVELGIREGGGRAIRATLPLVFTVGCTGKQSRTRMKGCKGTALQWR